MIRQLKIHTHKSVYFFFHYVNAIEKIVLNKIFEYNINLTIFQEEKNHKIIIRYNLFLYLKFSLQCGSMVKC